MLAMPTIHWQPMAMIEGEKVARCHKIGLRSPEQLADQHRLESDFGTASCDSCHTRHTFPSRNQAASSCESCHMGSIIRSGRCTLIKARRAQQLEATQSPACRRVRSHCQTCHMQNGNHEVRTAGIPRGTPALPEDKQWAGDRAASFRLLVLDPTQAHALVETSRPPISPALPRKMATRARQDDRDLQSMPLGNFAREQLRMAMT